MAKILIAMLIGAGLGAAVTHEIMSRQEPAPAGLSNAVPGAADGFPQPPRAGDAVATIPQPPRVGSGESLTRIGAGEPRPRIADTADRPRVDVGIGPAPRVGAAGADPAIAQAASFEEAFSLALSGADEPWQLNAALMQVAETWLTAAPSQAIAALDRLTTQDQRRAYIEALARTSTAQRPELLGEIVAHLRGPNEQQAVINAVGQSLAGYDEPEALLGVAESLPGMLGEILPRMVYAQMAQRNPLAALARIDAMPPGDARDILLMSSITQLALRDPSGALSWLSARQGSLDPNLYLSVAGTLGQQQPELAAQYTASVPESARGGWIAAVARGMAGRDVDAALSWLSSWRNTSYYTDALAGVAQQVAGYDPARAAQLLGQIDTQSQQGQMAVTAVAMMWANSDPDGALAWAQTMPRGETRDRALMALAARIGEPLLEDSMLGLFSSAPMRDSAAGSVIASIARTDPARAQALIGEHISNPAIAQRITAIVDGTQSGSLTAIRAPIGFGVPMPGTVFYSGAGAGVPPLPVSGVPQLTVSGDVTNFVIHREAAEK